MDVPLAWDLSGYDGRTDGEVALAGKFLDEAGQPLTSMLPLEITVRWYTPVSYTHLDQAQYDSAVHRHRAYRRHSGRFAARL